MVVADAEELCRSRDNPLALKRDWNVALDIL